MQIVTLFNLTHACAIAFAKYNVRNHFFQEFAKLKYTPNLKISKSPNLTNAKISRPKVSGYSMIHEMKLKYMSTDVFLRNKSVMRKPKDL